MKILHKLKIKLQRRKALEARVLAAEMIAEHALKQAECYRAQLLQLRVYQDTAPKSRRVGWMVSAFIPNEVVEQLKSMPIEKFNFYVTTVAKVLVDKAVRGILHVTRKGKLTAVLFEPAHNDPRKRITSEVYETDEQRIEVTQGGQTKWESDKGKLITPPFTPRQLGWRGDNMVDGQ